MVGHSVTGIDQTSKCRLGTII